jgi:hypothetical protein
MCEDFPPTFVFSHLIIASKFNVPPIAHNVRGSNVIYELTIDVMGIIQNGLEAHYMVTVDED